MGHGRDIQPRKRRPPPDLGAPSAGTADPDYSQSRTIREREDARYRKIKADQAQLDLDAQRGRVHDIEACKRERLAKFGIVRRRVMALHKDLPPQLIGLEARQMSVIIEKRCRQLLQALADGK